MKLVPCKKCGSATTNTRTKECDVCKTAELIKQSGGKIHDKQ